MIRSIFLYLFWFSVTTTLGQDYIKIRGASLESPSHELNSSNFEPLVNLGANWVAIIPYGFSRKGDPNVYFNSDRQWWGEREEGVEVMIQAAQQKGLKVMVKPQVWIHRAWVGDFYCSSEEEWEIWERTYSDYILTFAKLSERLGVELFWIGTEYRKAALMRPKYWLNLIDEVRKVYSGKITYAANWDDFEQITFWEKLDFIGVNAYFPLSDESLPMTAELVAAWKEPKERMRDISDQYHKQVILSEFGYRSVVGAAGNQWESERNKPDEKVQRRAYLALFEALWMEPFIAGGFFWKWEFRTSESDVLNNRYTPQGKTTLSVVEAIYRNSISR
jgi:hypothetical protein